MLPPRDAAIEMDRMVPPDVDGAAGVLLKARKKPATAQNESERAYGRQTKKVPNHANATDNNRRAEVPPDRRRQGFTESTSFHITTRKTQRRERLSGVDDRKHKKQSQKTRDRRRSWGVKTPWKWRVPQTWNRKRASECGRTGEPQRGKDGECSQNRKMRRLAPRGQRQ